MVFYIGKKVIYCCTICGKHSKGKSDAYIWLGDAYFLTGYNLKIVCKKCARREAGSKKPRKWEAINENSITLPEEFGIR